MATKFIKSQEVKVKAIVPQGPVEKLRMDEDGNFFYMITSANSYNIFDEYKTSNL
jgi:hypothetical protein